jgi:GNAT superfamily N-acetyltransferase
MRGEMDTISEEKNPAFDHCDAVFYMAYKDGEAVGRIAGIINEGYIEQWKRKHARFWSFECIDDKEVSGALLDEVEKWAISKGMEGIVGPMGFSTFERQGILVKGFNEMPTFSGIYNYAYYPAHFESHGYDKEIDYVEYEVQVPGQIPEKAVKVRDILVKRYNFRSVQAERTKDLLPYADQVFQVINEAYKPLFGFVRLTEKQIEYLVDKYFSFIRPDYTTLVVDEDDNVLGFQISMPSMSRAFQRAKGRLFPFGIFHVIRAFKKPNRIDILRVGVHPAYQNKGVNALFMTDLTQIAIDKGIQYAESNAELEENVKVQNFWRYCETRQHRRTRIYFKNLIS